MCTVIAILIILTVVKNYGCHSLYLVTVLDYLGLMRMTGGRLALWAERVEQEQGAVVRGRQVSQLHRTEALAAKQPTGGQQPGSSERPTSGGVRARGEMPQGVLPYLRWQRGT